MTHSGHMLSWTFFLMNILCFVLVLIHTVGFRRQS